jgi:flagellar biosynthesis protein FlhG
MLDSATLPHGDQATGLRGMFKPALRVLPTVSGARGVGLKSVIVNLAAAIAAGGQRPVVIDGGRALVASALGLKARYELMQLLTGEREFDEAVLSAGDFSVLPATKGIEAFVDSGATPPELFGAFTTLSQPFDCALLAVPARMAAALTPVESEIVFVTNDSADVLTATYQEIKVLNSEYGRLRFRIIFNGVRDVHRAQDAYARLADTAQLYFHAELALGGMIPMDAAVKRASAASTHVFKGESSPARQAFARLAASLPDWRLAEFSATPVH